MERNKKDQTSGLRNDASGSHVAPKRVSVARIGNAAFPGIAAGFAITASFVPATMLGVMAMIAGAIAGGLVMGCTTYRMLKEDLEEGITGSY